MSNKSKIEGLVGESIAMSKAMDMAFFPEIEKGNEVVDNLDASIRLNALLLENLILIQELLAE